MNGDEMMHEAWCGIGDVPYFFQGHPLNFKATQDKNRRFGPPLIDGYEIMNKAWSSIEAVPYCFFKVISQISRSHGTKNLQFSLNFGHQIWFCTRLMKVSPTNSSIWDCITLEGPEDRHLRNSSCGGHVTSLTLQYLWPRPPGVWLGGPGCKPGHSRRS